MSHDGLWSCRPICHSLLYFHPSGNSSSSFSSSSPSSSSSSSSSSSDGSAADADAAETVLELFMFQLRRFSLRLPLFSSFFLISFLLNLLVLFDVVCLDDS